MWAILAPPDQPTMSADRMHEKVRVSLQSTNLVGTQQCTSEPLNNTISQSFQTYHPDSGVSQCMGGTEAACIYERRPALLSFTPWPLFLTFVQQYCRPSPQATPGLNGEIVKKVFKKAINMV